jgi:hypothetical protein
VLWYRASAAGAWIRYQQRPASGTYAKISVSAHLLDWRSARYRMDACNAAGCTSSPLLSVSHLMREAVGYFKPSVSLVQGKFGHTVALSADGRTLAVSNGETEEGPNFPEPNALVVYLYRRVGSDWVLDTRLVPQPAEHSTSREYERTLALNGDGTVLVVGIPDEGAEDVSNRRSAGAVHIYRRSAGQWQLEQKLTPGDLWIDEWYGQAVDVDDAGETLALTRYYVNQVAQPGHAHIFRRGTAGWEAVAEMPVYYWELGKSLSCGDISLAGDGRTFARRCTRVAAEPFEPHSSVVQVFSAPAWSLTAEIVFGEVQDIGSFGSVDLNVDGTVLVSGSESATVVFRLNSANHWVAEGPLPGSQAMHGRGTSASIGRNGKFIALSDAGNRTIGNGAIYPPFIEGAEAGGAVRIFERRTAGWALKQTIKSNTSTTQAYGFPVALGDNGSVLAVGAADEPSAANGIDGDQTDTSLPMRGAVWVY